MSVFYKYVSKAVWKASRNLARDLRELELMQTTTRASLDRFVAKSLSKTRELLESELKLLNYKNIIFQEDEIPSEDGIYILVNPIDGLDNLKKALPFFSISLAQIKITNREVNILSSVISFPGFAEVMYSEKGQGAWVERHDDNKGGNRLRSSKENDIAKSLVNKNFAIFEKKCRYTRDFGCDSYDLLLFSSGKFDAIYVKNNSRLICISASLFAAETGAFYKKLESGDVVAINSTLALDYK